MGINIFLGGGHKPKQALISQEAAAAAAKDELRLVSLPAALTGTAVGKTEALFSCWFRACESCTDSQASRYGAPIGSGQEQSRSMS